MTIEFEFDQIEPVIRRHLMSAQSSVKIAVAWLNFKIYQDIFEALLGKGISLSIVVDGNGVNKNYTHLIDRLKRRNAKVYLLVMPLKPEPNEKEYRYIMHHKFAIIDNNVILAGSYNWSKSAIYNFENLFVINDADTKTINKFNEEFDFLLSMNTEKLEKLHHLIDCSSEDCIGKRLNLLVFEPNRTEGGHNYGTLLNVCTEDPYSHFETLDTDISSRFLQNAAEARDYHYQQLFEFLGDPELDKDMLETRKKEIDEMIDEDILKAMKSIGNGPHTYSLHAIGVLKREKMWHRNHDPDWFTEVLWTQRFCWMYLDDQYETDFDLCC